MGQWRIVVTEEAKRHLTKITDERVRAVIKASLKGLATDPDKQGKPPSGDLEGYRSLRIVGQRYRILYKVENSNVTVYVVAVGTRKEGDKADIYEVATKLLRMYTEKQSRQHDQPRR